MPRQSCLLAIGSNPPSQTSGARTLARLDLARHILGFDSVRIVNLFALPSYRSGGLSELGDTPEGWLTARDDMAESLGQAEAVLLAYGVQIPSGPARHHFRDQVAWLEGQIGEQNLPTWWVGSAPRHPTRWQRHTWREFSNMEFEEALKKSLVLRGAPPAP